MESLNISAIDIAIIAVYLVFIIWWGLRHGKSQNAGSYFLAGRSMPWWIIGLSLFAASISSTTLIGQTGDAYDTGIAVFNYNLTGVLVLGSFWRRGSTRNPDTIFRQSALSATFSSMQQVRSTRLR